MAKFKVEFENGVDTYTLTFRNKEFNYSMNQEYEYGVGSDKPCFSYQLCKEFKDLDEDELIDYVEINELGCYVNDSEIVFTILERLEEFE